MDDIRSIDQLKSKIEAGAAATQARLAAVSEEIREYEQLVGRVSALEVADRPRTLVNIGADMFMQAELSGGDVFVCVGSGIFAPLPPERAKAFAEERAALLRRREEALKRDLSRMEIHARMVTGARAAAAAASAR